MRSNKPNAGNRERHGFDVNRHACRLFRVIRVILVLMLAGSAATEAGGQGLNTPPQRVVSLGVCADQLVLSLAAPSQIAFLSADSTNPAISYHAALAAPYATGASTIERMIAIEPDLILADAGTRRGLVERLEALGWDVVVLDPAKTVDQAIFQVGFVAELLGQRDAGNALVRTIEAARRQASRTNWGATVVSFRDGGRVSGNDSLMANLLGVVGLNNVGDELSGGRGFVPLEVLVSRPPDYIVVPDESVDSIYDRGLLEHPAIDGIFPLAVRMEVANNLTICGGPSIPEALRRLASELSRVTP